MDTSPISSAARCCSAWKVPIRRPNCLRSLRYCRVRSNASRARPDSSAASTARPARSAAARAAAPSAIGSAATLSRVTRAALRSSTMRLRSMLTPSALGSTRNSAVLSPWRAATSSRSATWASSTSSLPPLRVTPSPAALASVLIASGRCLAPSSTARAVITLPSAIAGSHFCCCSALPPVARAVAPNTAVDRNGVTDRLRPISRATRPAPTRPKPMPPCSSGTRMPVRPDSTMACHSGSS